MPRLRSSNDVVESITSDNKVDSNKVRTLLIAALLQSLCLSCANAAPRTTYSPGLLAEDWYGNASEFAYADGCYVCGDYRCPSNPAECLLGSVPDTCGCCTHGVCARLDGEPCWNSSVAELPKERRNEGLCARNYLCLLRNDLEPEDVPEATCACTERSLACGNDNRTYANPCALHEEAKRHKDLQLRLAHLGPCPSRPSIYSPPDKIVEGIRGLSVTLSCEARGFPIPDVFWEFHAADGRRVLMLANEDFEDGYVNTSEDPELMLRTSWLQLTHFGKRHVGTYICIANNSIGEASAMSFLRVAAN